MGIAMGNSIHKRTSQSAKVSRPRGAWLFRAAKKKTTAGPRGHGDHEDLGEVHYRASQQRQENVFMEARRPQHLQDLHTEAQEGLEEMLLLQEHKNGWNLLDQNSLSSTDTLQDLRTKDGSLESGIDSGNSRVPTTTSVSFAWPVPTCQAPGSTFKPLNPVRTSEKVRRRTRRTTIMGIPQQVHKELEQHRSSTHLPDGDQPGLIVIPTIDGDPLQAHEGGVRVNLSDLEARGGASTGGALHTHQGLRSRLPPTSRPKSLAVPGTTSPPTGPGQLQEPQGPVMSISPQAPYLSRIIPNAVLPASVDVIQIDRGTSLALFPISSSRAGPGSGSSSGSASPASSARSDGGNSFCDNRLRRPAAASGSHRSRSPSSETVTSNLSSAGSRASRGGSEASPSAEQIVKNSKSFTRSLSVMKSKLPPAPPQRINSLHGNQIGRRSTDPPDVAEVSAEEGASSQPRAATAPVCGSGLPNGSRCLGPPGSLGPQQTSSSGLGAPLVPPSEHGGAPPLQRTSEEEEGVKFERTMSPSSGYSSQSGTPTMSQKGLSTALPGRQAKVPGKPERSDSQTSSADASPSPSLNSLSSGTSEPVVQEAAVTNGNKRPPQQAQGEGLGTLPPTCFPSPLPPATGSALRKRFHIPPPPKIRAPCPPPPEAWAHNSHTVALLCGPPTHTGTTAGQVKASWEELPTAIEEVGSPLSSSQHAAAAAVSGGARTESGSQNVQMQRDGAKDTEGTLELEEGTNKEPPLLVKKPTAAPPRLEPSVLPRERSDRLQQSTVCSGIAIEVHPAKEDCSGIPEPRQNGSEDFSETDRGGIQSEQHTLSVDTLKGLKVSPPPSPPPSYHRTEPPGKTSPPTLCTEALEGILEGEIPSVESCWPPPPPPPTPLLEETDDAFGGEDEMDDFPLPPPPFMPDVVDSHSEDTAFPSPSGVVAIAAEASTKEAAVSCSDDECADLTVGEPPPFLGGTSSVAHPAGGDKSLHNCPSFPEGIPHLPVESPPVHPSGDFTDSSMQTEVHASLEPRVSASPSPPQASVPQASPPPVQVQVPGVSFRRQPSLGNRDSRSKELLSRHKSAPFPKEDANIPLVTPSLLQMVRLRSVGVVEGQDSTPSEDGCESAGAGEPAQKNGLVSSPTRLHTIHSVPQKPIRKSLSLQCPPQAAKEPATAQNASPSVRLQEAIRMKTAAMSARGGFLARPCGVRSPARVGTMSESEITDVHRTPASTASFIFARNSKRVVMETPGTTPSSSVDTRASLRQSLVTELMQVSDGSKAAAALPNGTSTRSDKVPPPVARKPAHLSSSGPPQIRPVVPVWSAKVTPDAGASGELQHELSEKTTTTVTPDSIETLF